ncbi:relaxase/mobilization nuclease domain-containing protein [Pseudomaricurvus alcaniphilus]|uniref:relaxase/mobilization nuclease domain-containing protein n=1 Tax=Pseudomaricurvus alcaniphilus TaxID=1166482 RepID=UPI00140B3406|nr:LPD7 domain-containing protein [Pseudomaricurvus alcaniphilus]
MRNSRGACSGKVKFSATEFLINKIRYLVDSDPKRQGYNFTERVALVESTNFLPFLHGDCSERYAEDAAAEMYRWTDQFRGEKKSPAEICIDRVVSFHPDDLITPLQALQYTKQAVAKVMGPLEERFCLFSVHVDEKHTHVHFLASTVNSSGRVFNLRQDDRVWNQAVIKLEKQYGLVPVKGRSIECKSDDEPAVPRLTKGERQLKKYAKVDSHKFQVREIIDRVIDTCGGDFDLFLDGIMTAGVFPVINLRKENAPIRGISFEHQGEYFSGSDLGKRYSWGGIKKAAGYTEAFKPLLYSLKLAFDKEDGPADLTPMTPMKNTPASTSIHKLLKKPLAEAFTASPYDEGITFKWRSSQRVAFKEKRTQPQKITTNYGRNRKAVKAMVERAHALGWRGIRVKGPKRFQELVAEFATEYNLPVVVAPAAGVAQPEKPRGEGVGVGSNRPDTPGRGPDAPRAESNEKLASYSEADQSTIRRIAQLKFDGSDEEALGKAKAYFEVARERIARRKTGAEPSM